MRSNKFTFGLTISLVCMSAIVGFTSDSRSATAVDISIDAGILSAPDSTVTGSGLLGQVEIRGLNVASNTIWAIGVNYVDLQERISDQGQQQLQPYESIDGGHANVYGKLGFKIGGAGDVTLDLFTVFGASYLVKSISMEGTSETTISAPEYLYGGGGDIEIAFYKNTLLRLSGIFLDTRWHRLGNVALTVGVAWRF